MYRVQDGCSNLPPNIYGYGQLLVVHGAGDTIAQMYFNYNNNDTWIRSGNPSYVGGPGDYLPWELISTATKPQEYSLPLAAGWVNEHTWDKNCYCKTQENIVIVHFSAKNTSAVDPEDDGYIVGYLPEGFRPSYAVIGTCGDYNYGGTSICQFWIHASGEIVIFSPGMVPPGSSGTIAFVAADQPAS